MTAPNEGGRALAARLGPLGVWASQLQWQTAALAQEAVARIAGLGYRAVWVGEATGKEAVAHASVLLGGGGDIVVATGIASIAARDPMAMANAARTLEDAYPGRFVLGLGVSHAFLNEQRDRPSERPYEQMAAYLDAMDEAPFVGPRVAAPPRVLAALGPRMLRLARDRAAGAHPYFVPVEHTSIARETLGTEPLLAPEQAVVLQDDPSIARGLARRHMATYLPLASYATNLRRLGWDDEDLRDGGSDRLVDALVAWGDAGAIAARIREHRDRGADHVAVRVLTEDPARVPIPELEAIAAAAG
ncbi:MAG: TIGR03620 family F420-dependent LLM class oxidoreductase [Actinobacteria bacterium]|nr:MAG: TIGR03620 family F420-dependent LLM class oxidoreductase [Actinomycetota bacterium]